MRKSALRKLSLPYRPPEPHTFVLLPRPCRIMLFRLALGSALPMRLQLYPANSLLICSINLEPCTSADDCISLDGVTDCTCYTRAAGCEMSSGASGYCLPGSELQTDDEPCSDDSQCPSGSFCVVNHGGSFCYFPFAACAGEASVCRMFEKREGLARGGVKKSRRSFARD